MDEHSTGVTTNGLCDITISKKQEAEQRTGWILPDPRMVFLSSSMVQHERIAVDPNILGGEPHVRGTRIPIAVILDGLAEGLTPEELMEHYPRLTLEDIRAAIGYAAANALSPQE